VSALDAIGPGMLPVLLLLLLLHASILRIGLGALTGGPPTLRRAAALAAACMAVTLPLSLVGGAVALAGAAVVALTLCVGIVSWGTGTPPVSAAKVQAAWVGILFLLAGVWWYAGGWAAGVLVAVVTGVGLLPAPMRPYIVRKLLLAIPLILLIVTLIFQLLELSPGTVADKFFTPETPPEVRQMIVEKYHLDDPAYVRYAAMIGNLATFDFGRSMAQEREVFEIIREALPNTLLLSMLTLMVAFPTGILIGTVQAVRQNTAIDTSASVGSLLLYSMPGFWLGMMLQLLVAFYLSSWLSDLGARGLLSDGAVSLLTLPSSGMIDPVMHDYMSPGERIIDRLKHLILPGVAMGMASAGSTARYMRSALLEVIRKDYIRTARAKGLSERAVIIKHGMRNALLPIVTIFGLSIPYLFGGSVLIEMIFAWPGMGRVILAAIYSQDTPLLIAAFYVYTLLVVAGNLTADVLYAWVDPRIKLA